MAARVATGSGKILVELRDETRRSGLDLGPVCFEFDDGVDVLSAKSMRFVLEGVEPLRRR